MKEEGGGVTEKGEDNQNEEWRKKVFKFFTMTIRNAFKTVEV